MTNKKGKTVAPFLLNKKGKTAKVTEKEPKRFKVSEMLQGDTRLKNESYEDYKERRKVEHILVKQYLKGTMV